MLFILIHTLSLNVKQIAVMIASPCRSVAAGCSHREAFLKGFYASEICIYMVLCRWSQCQYSDMV